MGRYFIELAYNGKDYNGWQIQPNAPSIQEELNKVLSTILRREVYVVGAGRTDTGVHAAHYTAHFDTECEIEDSEKLVHKMNRMIGKNIAIYKLYPVEADMHARFSAVSRTYKYYINKQKDPFTFDFAWQVFPLPDITLMNEACKILFEYSDFTSFSKLHTATKTNECRIMEACWEDTGKQLVFTIRANRFLRNMVRAIVGTMVEIGQGKVKPEELRRIIAAKDRCSAGTSVPGYGLFLYDIEYNK